MTRSQLSPAAIRERRKRAGLTQQELAAKAGIPQSCISFYELGKRGLSGDSLVRIDSALSPPGSDAPPISEAAP